MKYEVQVFPKYVTRTLKRLFRKNHLYWNGFFYTGKISLKSYYQIEKICKHNHIKYQLAGDYGQRSTDYRYIFFKNNPPPLFNKYFCSYCGSLIQKDKITVDHLYPVDAVKKNPILQKKLKKKGYKSVNDVRNLVPACYACNKSKSASLGKWIIKGKIGRYPWIWVIRHFVRISILLFIMYQLIYLFSP